MAISQSNKEKDDIRISIILSLHIKSVLHLCMFCAFHPLVV